MHLRQQGNMDRNESVRKFESIVTETNVHFLTDAALQEWNDAVDEYHQKVEAGETQ
jgi:hypothetical protein